MATDAPLPACTDGSAYASLLTSHGDVGGNTFMTRGGIVLGRQVLMLTILLRSLRSPAWLGTVRRPRGSNSLGAR